ncbi:MAG: glycerol kinase GlpK [Acidobacteria bacterium]|nr:glycerol kinase GlpK [Acidobacteriota bacterium]
MQHVVALDEGTTSARALVFDEQARILGVDQIPVQSSYPHDGWVEQDAERIWQAQSAALRRAIERSGVDIASIAALGITNQRETAIVWDRKTGEPICPAIVWQCRRTADACRALLDAGHGPFVAERTGLVIDAYFSGPKIAWILDHVPDARRRAEAGELAFGTVDSWLIWKLTGGRTHSIDVTNASRTMLLNLETGAWDDDMLSLLGIPRPLLPTVAPSCGVVGLTDPSVLGREIPIAGVAGDQQAALFGQACFRPGMSKNTYGTGCFLLEHTGSQRPVSSHKMLATAASAPTGRAFALEGAIFIAGAAIQWLRDSLGLLESAAESAALAASVPDTAGVYMVPAFVGLGAPHWDSNARGIITGLTQAARREHLVRATLESIAYQARDLADAMEADSGAPLRELRADGGAAANDFLLQFQADILGCPVVRPANVETTAAGAAFLAGLAVDVWSGTDEIEGFWKADRRFEPQMDAARRDELHAGWKKAIHRARA